MADSMYLKQLIDKNVGPLTDVQIDFPFNNDGTPKPIILVGENGTGKSTILSNIVDSFFEIAGRVFSNVTKMDGSNGYQYYKTISPSEIHTGAQYMYSYILYDTQDNLKYLFKAGTLSVDELKKQIGDSAFRAAWQVSDNVKIVTASENLIKAFWRSNVFCYFGPDRYEKPAWMGDKYFRTEEILHPTINQNYEGILKNPIAIKNVTSSNLQWLLDVIADSRADIEGTQANMKLAHHMVASNMFLLKQARSNLETILSKILGEDVYFQLNYRNSGSSRFKVVNKKTDKTVCPTLDSLSTGQIALFNLFATIVRYADNNDINQSFHLNNITGIVAIDEIDLHLHTKLQKEVLPTLLKLFPKIQFVITTHAPLFLLGMKETFGENGFEVLELPSATKISIEKFSEFQKAYAYLQETEFYQQDVKKALDSMQTHGKAIIVTEGSTDWKHLKAAYEHLKGDGKHQALFDGLEFELFEYEPEESIEEATHKLDMGNTVLAPLCANMAKLPQQNKYIFLADRDDEQTNKKMSVSGAAFKDWGNNVYSFVLPIPPHRMTTPAISIEHYYTDNEIKTEWHDPNSGITYRLYMGNEFDERGIASEIDRFCEKRNKCGRSSIAIIEGSSGERVTCISDNTGINYALSKSKFAKMILDKEAPFDSFDFESFLPIFEIIKSIIGEKREGSDV